MDGMQCGIKEFFLVAILYIPLILSGSFSFHDWTG
jgi:hypothetical protein